MIKKWLSGIDVQPGFSTAVMEALEKKVRHMDPMDRYCSIVFDEMSIKEGFVYDESRDEVLC